MTFSNLSLLLFSYKDSGSLSITPSPFSPVILSIYNPAELQARLTAAGYKLLTSNAKDRHINIDAPLNAKTDTRAVSGEVDWDLGAKGSLTSITAYEYWKCFTNNDNDYTQLNAIPDYGSCNKEHQFSQELRWSTPKDLPVEATLGGFLSRQRLQVDSRIRFGNQYYIWAANPSATAFPTLGGKTWAQGAYATQVAGVGLASQAIFHTDTEALFGNLTWHPDAARRLAIDVGLRQTWERRSELYDGSVVSNLANLTQIQLNALSPSGANAQLGHVDQHLRDSSLSGEAGVSYKVTSAVMLYGKFARGYKSKGFNLLPENSTNPDPSVANAVAFGATKGLLPLPVSGTTLRRFGEDDGLGGNEKGLLLETKTDSIVAAPADGWIAYAGPYRSFGQLVILNAGGGYYIVLAGMERINVSLGQFVLAGEPVAVMGDGSTKTAAAIALGAARPVLYVEFRKDGTTIDPGPWWAKPELQKVRG